VSDGVLDLARRDAVRICVGKAAGTLGSTQEEINALLIEHAKQGRRVVRLKGGDPFVFGRGGEELQALAAAQIAFSVVPGITAALGAAAYAGIPLTHRDHAHAVTFVTGHSQDDGVPGREPDWGALAKPGTTAVFYMGLARLDRIAARLMEHGAPAARPAAIIAQASTAQQRVILASLATLSDAVARENIESPALLVVGEVAALHASLAWFGPGAALDLSRTA
jgi:uroporphyrin-III C-methyltransferase/precorrin-2 dehydrogenase/sirohydrochlorin ferrochelatase